MDSSYPIMPTGQDRPAAERSRGLARPAPGAVPVHAAGKMGLSSDVKLRQECWDMIGERTRARLRELTGPALDWYAGEDASSGDGRPYAVVFGGTGLGIAEPRINTEHRPVYAISAFLFDPASLRHIQVDHRPPPYAQPGSASGGPGGTAGPDLGLSAAARGLLGNLPPRAQELLQTPFTAGQRVVRCDWAYEGHDHQLNMFMIYLAGPQDVTVATGTKVVPAGHTDQTAHWSLTCYRASVVRRIGR